MLADPLPAAPKKASEMEQAVVQAFGKRSLRHLSCARVPGFFHAPLGDNLNSLSRRNPVHLGQAPAAAPGGGRKRFPSLSSVPT